MRRELKSKHHHGGVKPSTAAPAFGQEGAADQARAKTAAAVGLPKMTNFNNTALNDTFNSKTSNV